MAVLRKSKVIKHGNESILSVNTKKLDLITKASDFDEYILIKKPGVSTFTSRICVSRELNQLEFLVEKTFRQTSLCAQSPATAS